MGRRRAAAPGPRDRPRAGPLSQRPAKQEPPASDAAIPRAFGDLDADYLTRTLGRAGALGDGRVARVDVEPLGEGLGFVGSLARLRLDYAPDGPAGPAAVVVKLPGENRVHRALAELGQSHEREVRFYRELAGRARIGTPAVYEAAYDPDPREATRDRDRRRLERLPVWLHRWLLPMAIRSAGRSRRRYLLVLEDLAPRETRDQVAGCALEDARIVARALAGLHAGFWNDPALGEIDWLPRVDDSVRAGHAAYRMGRPDFVRACGESLAPHFLTAADWVDAHLPAVLDRLAAPPVTLLHGDFRLDNLLFEGPAVTAVDWQSVGVGRGMIDWANFVGGSLAESIDPAGEEALLHDYHDALVAGGVRDYPLEDCRRDYALSMLLIGFVHVAAARFLSLEGERGEALWSAMRRRIVRRMPPPPWAWLL